jgi:hypothetical protein
MKMSGSVTTTAVSDKQQKINQIVRKLVTSGQNLSDEDLQTMQAKTDALRAEDGHHEDHSHHPTIE